MKLEGEYAIDKVARAHRISSGVLYAIWILLSFERHGLGSAFRTAAHHLLPMACIWFPDAMASYTGLLWGMGRNITERSHPLFIRWAGWLLLLIVPLILMVIFALAR